MTSTPRFNSACACALTLTVTACGATYDQHGYAPPDPQLHQVRVGVDRRVDVERKIGSPIDAGLSGEDNWYYLATTVERFAYREPKVVERRLITVAFNAGGIVEEVTVEGIEASKDVPLALQTTETYGQRIGFFQQLFGNLLNIQVSE